MANGSVQPQYLTATDPRIANILRQFEQLVAACPTEFCGWQTAKVTRKTDVVLVEIISSFKFELANSK